MKRRSGLERYMYVDEKGGFWRRRWVPEKSHPRGGRDRWVSLGKDSQDARRRYHELELDAPAGRDRDGPVRSVARAWLDRYVKVIRDEKGFTLAETRVRLYLTPYLGSVYTRKLTEDDLLLYRAYLEGIKSKHTGKKLSEQTVAHILADLKCMLIWARVKRGVIPKRLIPKPAQKSPRALDSDQQAAVRIAEDPYGLAVRIMIDSGVRWSELCRLTRDDLVNGELRIHGPTKNRRKREVPIPPALVAEIKGHVGKLVPFERKDVSWFNRAVRSRSDVPEFSAHRCRHSFGFNYMRDGGNLLVLKEQMGHSTVELTAVYARPTQDLVRQDAAKVFRTREA